MPLTKEQTDILKSGLAKIFNADVPWSAEGQPDGTCDKVVTLVDAIDTEKLTELTSLMYMADCKIDIKARSKHLSVSFS